jgi:hypothetical protein
MHKDARVVCIMGDTSHDSFKQAFTMALVGARHTQLSVEHSV